MKTLGGILGFIGGAVFGLYAYYSFDGIRHCFGAFDNCEDLYILIPQFANKIPLTDYILMGSVIFGAILGAIAGRAIGAKFPAIGRF